jgi:hypothetical protein
MKLKLKLDQRRIREFLLQSAEKIVLVVVVVVFLWMLYSALTTAARFGGTPGELQTKVADGRKAIDSTQAKSALVVDDYIGQAKQSRIDIPEKPYETLVRWDPPLFPKQSFRGEPPLLTVEDLRGTAGVGTFQTIAVPVEAAPTTGRISRFNPPTPAATPVEGELIRGQRWVVITGLVPVEKQEIAYAETFKPAAGYDPQKDYPEYSGYSVQRVEVASAAEAANPDWSKAKEIKSYTAVREALKQWSQSGADVVAPQYIDGYLAFPLGPRLNGEWDASVAHEPQIPFAKSEAAGMGPGRAGGMGPRAGGMGPRSGMMPGTPRGGGGAAAGNIIDFDANESPSPESVQDPRAEADALADGGEAVKYKLFRFFDFSVLPGKHYVYRVCLALKNPNAGVKTALLKKPELANDQYLKTKPSEPSAMVSVPPDTRILAGSVTPARAAAEPWGKILLITWIKDKGVEAFTEKAKVGRGQVLDFMDETSRLIGVASQVRQASRFGGGMPSTAPATQTVDYVTGATVVDLRGGERLPSLSGGRNSNLTAAGEILLLQSDGGLIVRNELEDTPVYTERTAVKEAATEEPGGPAIMGPRGGTRSGGGLDALEERPAGPHGMPRGR